MLRELWDVVEDDLVWVSEDVVVGISIKLWVHLSDDTGVNILEVGVSTELVSLLWVLEFFSHFQNKVL